MAQNHSQQGSERAPVEKALLNGGIYEVSSFDNINAKLDVLYQKLDNLSIAFTATAVIVTPNCEICGVVGHVGVACQFMVVIEPTPDQVNYAQQENPYSNTYNLSWRNHLNLPYNNNNPLFIASLAPPFVPLGFQGQKGARVATRK